MTWSAHKLGPLAVCIAGVRTAAIVYAAVARYWPRSLLAVLSSLAAATVVAVLCRYRLRQGFLRLSVAGLSLAVAAGLFELLAQGLALLRPTYDVLYLAPDYTLGWRPVPHMQFMWCGHHGWAKEFSVPVRLNGWGFHDTERSLTKPAGSVRIAFLGDSFVEGLQVPLEQTATQHLQKRLAGKTEPPWLAAPDVNTRPSQYEVLNFGVSGYSLGQCLLLYETLVHCFGPDLVIVLVNDFMLERNGRALGECGLKIRPVFCAEKGRLVLHMPQDYRAFCMFQEKRIAEWGGRRIQRRCPGWFLARCWQVVRQPMAIPTASRRLDDYLKAPKWWASANAESTRLSLLLLRRLHEQVRRHGARLVIADTCAFLNPGAGSLSGHLARVCDSLGIGYVPLSERLFDAQAYGIQICYPSDGHFTAAGHRLVAEALYWWLAEENDRRQMRVQRE